MLNNHFFCLTVEELGALSVAVLHLLTFVGGSLHVAVCGGEHRRPRLHQELTDLNVVAGGSTVEGSPGDEETKNCSNPDIWITLKLCSGVQIRQLFSWLAKRPVVRVQTHHPSLSAALALTPN